MKGVTLKTRIERELHKVVNKTEQSPPFRPRRASFEGKGLQPELKDASWDNIRDLAYEGRGS